MRKVLNNCLKQTLRFGFNSFLGFFRLYFIKKQAPHLRNAGQRECLTQRQTQYSSLDLYRQEHSIYQRDGILALIVI